MPPTPKRDCGVILFDVASSKKSELLNGLLKFASFRWFMNSKSMYRLILVNSAETRNRGNYPHIYTCNDLEEFDPKLIVQEIENMQPGESNWVDALRVGILALKEVVEMAGIVSLQLIFFTGFDNITPNFDDTSIQKVINIINKYENMYLYIIGPDVTLPFAITSQQSIANCMQELQVVSIYFI